MDQITLQFDQLIVPDPFHQYRRLEDEAPPCFSCVNCINCGCHFEKIVLPGDQPERKENTENNQKQQIIFKCEEKNCDKTFEDQQQFVNHSKKHEIIYECQFDNCDQTFKIKSNLKRHQKIHTKQKPFLCNECKKTFATTTNLKQHLQIHLVQNKRTVFECQYEGCNKKYYYLCNLKKHQKEHYEDIDIVFKTNSYNVMVANCSFTLSSTPCTCQGLQKIQFGYQQVQQTNKQQKDEKEQKQQKQNQIQLEQVLEKGIKDGKLRVGVLLQEGSDFALSKFQSLVKWAANSKMRAIHLSSLKQQTMLYLSQYMIDKVRKSMKAQAQKRG